MNRAPTPRAQTGAALVLALIATVALTFLGVALLLLSETENRIATNENRSGQALEAAGSVARVVQGWFDHPGGAPFLPGLAVVNRELREIVDESEPNDRGRSILPGAADWVRYRDRNDDLFERPYHGDLENRLIGTEAGPDLRIDDSTPAAASYLLDLSRALFDRFPSAGPQLEARVRRIDLFAPPYFRGESSWVRHGIGTIRVVAGIYDLRGGLMRTVAEREVRVVIGAVPYAGPVGPLHSCASLTLTGRVGVHWGLVMSTGPARLSTNLGPCPGGDCRDLPTSLPRAIPMSAAADPLWNVVDPAAFESFVAAVAARGESIPDPWFRVIAGGAIDGAGAGMQPFPPPPTGPVPQACCDRSNLFQGMPLARCPGLDYARWKSIASSGGRNVRYFAWDGGTAFRENGVGPAADFREWTRGAEGLFFFDTRDASPPASDLDGDGVPVNLTPEIVLRGGTWGFRGLLYLNARSFRIDGAEQGSPTWVPDPLVPPGEPFQDLDGDGLRTDGEPWIDLAYPSTLVAASAPIAVLSATSPGSGGHDSAGFVISGGQLAFQGILFTNGLLEARGSGTMHGSVIARAGVVQVPDDGTASVPDLYWDPRIVTGWPPPGWNLPRVTILASTTVR